ncbi:multiple inositol polyphosphate phosphatase 1-like [Ostrinia nubilalis]|uniref:multiple inositol polyphosphate phosphatase 1-like n=1 Tax=Ostrinia nubilalis TaxID=29057 RepID=UPI003082217D
MGWSLPALLALATLGSAQLQETCLSVEEDPYLLFGTKTAYIFANRGLPNNNRAHEVPGCQPVAFWMMQRHGSHNPEADEIERLQNLTDLKNNIISNYRNSNFRNTNKRICVSDVKILEHWQYNPRHNLSFAGDLTSDGYLSAQQLAQAFKRKYPELFTDNRHNYLFKYVKESRLSTTFRAFSEGIFKTMIDSDDLPKENDEKLLRPYKFCNAWTKSTEENPDSPSQRTIFESKYEYKQMVTNVSLRLGFNYDVDAAVVRGIYLMCRYNKAWDVTQISPWCAAFTREDLRRLEYAEDLETYYKYGYGNDLNKKVGCAYVKDMMSFFSKHVENEMPQQPQVMVHLTEAPAILLALGAMATHQDTVPLTGDNYHSAAIQARKWASSKMAPFNANLAAVLYKCTLNGNFQINDQYQVLLLENERPISLDWCRVGLCEWSQIVSKLGEVANACDLEACNGATAIGQFVAITVALVFFAVRSLV